MINNIGINSRYITRWMKPGTSQSLTKYVRCEFNYSFTSVTCGVDKSVALCVDVVVYIIFTGITHNKYYRNADRLKYLDKT